MQKFVLRSLVFGGLLVGASACTDDGEKLWPKAATSGAATSGAASSSGTEASSSGTAGNGGMGGASTSGMGGMGGAAGNGGMGGSGGANTGGMGGTAGNGGSGGSGGAGGGSALPPDPMNLTVVISGKDVKIDWTKSVKPTSLILRKLGSTPTDANDPAAAIVYNGAGEATLEPLRNLLPNTPTVPRTYHYAVFGCDGTCGGTPALATLSPTITQSLVGGGYNLLWRHASADVCADQLGLGTAATTSSPDWWKSCDASCPVGQTATATARQLNAMGTMESMAIGNSLAQKGIPFSRMISSEYCRCLTTAQLMNVVPAANIEQKPEVTYYVYDEANRCSNSMMIAATEPPAGGNTGVVGHAGFVCPTLDALAWGEAAIYKPNGMGGSTFITRVQWNEWDALP